MFCPNCGTQNEDSAKFCVDCGTVLTNEENEQLQQEQQTAPETVVETPAEVPAEESAQEIPVEEITEESQKESTPTFAVEEEYEAATSSITKKIIIAAVAVAVVIVAVFAAFKIVNLFNDEVDYSKFPLVYVKDDEVMVRPHGKKESYELSEAVETDYYRLVQLTEKGDGIFFADDFSSDGFELYYRKTKDMNADGKGQQIAKDVKDFEVVAGKKEVVYVEDGGKLYHHNLKKEKLIDKHVTEYRITYDGKKVFYNDEDGDLYVCGFGKNDKPEKIDSEVGVWSIASSLEEGEYNKLYYVTDDGKLYLKEKGKSKKKIAGDVYDAYVLDGNVFVVKDETKEYKFKDLIIDDISDDLESIEEEYEEIQAREPDYDDYDDYDEYSDAWDEWWDESMEASELLDMYENVEDIEEYFDENPYTVENYTLYKLKGTKLEKIDENLIDGLEYTYSEKHFIYEKSENTEIKKIKLSDIDNVYDAQNQIRESMEKNKKDIDYCILNSNGKSFVGFTTDENVSSIEISESGKNLYALIMDKDNEGELVRYNIASSKLTGKKELTDDIQWFTYWEDDFITARTSDDELVAIEKNKVTDVAEDYADVQYMDGYLYVLDDYSNYSGDLIRYKNGKKKTIVDDVHSFTVFSKNKIAYIQDYDEDDGYGDLYLCNKNGKAKQVDDEVSRIIE